MQYRERDGSVHGTDSGQDRLLKKLYTTAAGRALVRVLICPPFSRACGIFLNTRLSALFIRPFIRRAGICMEEYERRQPEAYSSFNDFFCRRIRAGRRPIDGDRDAFISPCDGKLSVYPVGADSRFFVKGTCYTLESLLRSRRLARRFEGGLVCLFRLEAADYHRYCYAASGVKSRQHAIPGVYHTVNPAAGEVCPVYKENSREYCLIRTEEMGTLVQMEVGALMVGKIRNYENGRANVVRGREKGRFEFGGSTVIVFVEPGYVTPDPDLTANTAAGWETRVRMGERIGSVRPPSGR